MTHANKASNSDIIAFMLQKHTRGVKVCHRVSHQRCSMPGYKKGAKQSLLIARPTHRRACTPEEMEAVCPAISLSSNSTVTVIKLHVI